MVESFEEYSKNRNNVDLKDFKIKLSKNGFDKNLSVLLFLIQQEKDIKEKYGILSYLIKITYLNIDSLNNYNNEQKQIIKDLFYIFYQLDSLCGCNEELSPSQGKEEMQRILKILDQDLEKFIDFLKKGYEKIKKYKLIVKILKEFASYIYIFNGYQAPYRTDPYLAGLDAAGLSNPFLEIWEKIEKS